MQRGAAWTGADGLAWAGVEPPIKSHPGDLPIPVIVYETYPKDHKAEKDHKADEPR